MIVDDGSRFFRSGLVSQADLLASCGNKSSAGPLRSPVVDRFIATMSPSDFRLGRQAVMCSHLTSAVNLPDSLPAPPDLSGSWQVSRYPPSSTTPRSCTAALARSFAVHVGFALYGRLAAPRFISRGRIRFTCVTADSFGRPGLRHSGSPRATPGRLHGQRAVTIVRTFQRTRPVKLRLTHHTMHKRICARRSPIRASYLAISGSAQTRLRAQMRFCVLLVRQAKPDCSC